MSFDFIILLGSISFLLLAGTVIRSKVEFFQKYLIPSTLIAGIVGALLVNFKVINIDDKLLSEFIFHLCSISFIALGFTSGNGSNSKNKDEKGMKTPIFRGAAWMAFLFWVIYALQGVIGYSTFEVFRSIGFNIDPVYGLLAPSGFANGPGQAASVSTILIGEGYEDAMSVGLSLAGIGFIACFAVGIPAINLGIKNGVAKHAAKLSDEVLKGVMKKNTKCESAGEQTFHSSNVETLSVHAGLIFGVYLLSYLLIKGIAILVPAIETFLIALIYVIGMIVAKVVKKQMTKAKVDYVLSTELNKRIAGISIDFMVVGSLMSFKIASLGSYLVPILVLSVVLTIFTWSICYYFGRRVGSSSDFERTLVLYGIATGTTNTGLVLLRIVDPEFKTDTVTETAMHLIIGDLNLGLIVPYVVLGTVLFGWSPLFNMGLLIVIAILYVGALKVLKIYNKETTYSLRKRGEFRNDEQASI